MRYTAVPDDVTWQNVVNIAKDFNKVYEVFLKADKERDLDTFKDFIDDNISNDVFINMTPSGNPNKKSTITDINGKRISLDKWGTNPFSTGAPFSTWTSYNFPVDQDVSNSASLMGYYASLSNLMDRTFGLMDVKKVKVAFHDLVEIMKDLTRDTSALFADIYPAHFSYKGFQISNPDRLSRYVVNHMLEGIEALVEVFKKRSMTKALQEGVQSVVFRFARRRDGGAAAIYTHRGKEITLFQKTIRSSHAGNYNNWVKEVFIHEFGHYIHLDYLSKEAKAVWDKGWTKVDEARYQEAYSEAREISQYDKRRYLNSLAPKYDFKALESTLQGQDLTRYREWLALPEIGLSSARNAVVLTKKAEEIMEFFQMSKEAFGVILNIGRNPLDPTIYFNEQAIDNVYNKRWTNHLVSIHLDGPDYETTDLIPLNTELSDAALAELNVPTEYAGENLKEDFAETFVMFLLKPERLSKIARYRMERALSLSGLYGRPVMQLAKVAANLVLQGHTDLALELLAHNTCTDPTTQKVAERKERIPSEPLVDVITKALKRNPAQRRYLKEASRLLYDERVLEPFQGKFHAYTPKQSIYYTYEARQLLQELRTSPLWKETEQDNLYITKKVVGAKEVVLVADVQMKQDAPVRLYLSPLTQVGSTDTNEALPDLQGTFPPDYYAVRFLDYGDPMLLHNAYTAMLSEYFHLTEEVARKLLRSDEGTDFIYRSSDVLDALIEHENLPPIPQDHFRFLHTFGLRAKSNKERWKVARNIIKEGLNPQADGSGAHSELPSAVFGITAFGDTPYRNLLYNVNMPWVTADIPFSELAPYEHITRSGSVLTLNSVPQKYIVGINGFPTHKFARAMQKWGPANERRAHTAKIARTPQARLVNDLSKILLSEDEDLAREYIGTAVRQHKDAGYITQLIQRLSVRSVAQEKFKNWMAELALSL